MRPLVRGTREFLFDEGGRRYIDAISGVYNTSYGHAHPRLVSVLRRLPTDTIFNCYDNPTPERLELEVMLRRLTGFSQVHLFSSGAETVEKALMLALRSLPEARRGVLHFSSSFHGKTMGTYGLFDNTKRSLLSYRVDRAHPNTHEEDLLRAMKGALRTHGIVILEPVMGYYGRVFSLDFLKKIRALCDETDSILIFDEMITAFGRAGVDFVSDLVKPDLLVIGKNLGQGLPIMAVLFSSVGPIDADGFSWTTATSSNALLCRVGLESCKVFVEEKMTAQSCGAGQRLRIELRKKEVLERFKLSHRGSMLFLKDSTDVSAKPFEDALREEHSILTRAHGSTLVLMPPYVISPESCELIAIALKGVLDNE